MSLIIGIDVGGSTTKIVGLSDGQVKSPMFITAADPITSLFGAFGRYLYDQNIHLSDIDHVMLTGVGSSRVETPIYGLPTSKADEFLCDGLGAKFATGLDRLTVVSMGTGTTFVSVNGDEIKHIGGLGMGGGTLQGLAHIILNTTDMDELVELASHGDISRVNLQIGDISAADIEGLPKYVTASLFAKAAHSNAEPCDIAKGLICMVLETIGSSAVLSSLNSDVKDFVLIGNMTRMPERNIVFPMIEDLYDVKFHVPEHAQFCTALGAALAHNALNL